MQIKLPHLTISLNRREKNTNALELIEGKNTVLSNFNLVVRKKSDIYPKRLKIGNDCLISGNFIFENENGIIIIGDNTFIGGGMFICIDKINIGNNVLISWGCTFIDNDSHSINAYERINDISDWKKGIEEGQIGKYKNWNNVEHAPIIIKDKAWIGCNCIILKGITIGEGAVIGAGSVVTKDVPDYTLAAGNPAQIIKKLLH
jgi:galactoside O-acetyltransferase